MHILIIDPFPPVFLEQLATLPVTIQYLPDADRNQVLETIGEAEVLVINSKIRVDQPVIERAGKLRLLVRAGVGMDHIDEVLLAEKGVRVRNANGANADAVGEMAVGMLLGLMRNLRRADAEVRRYEWRREANRGHEIKGRTVGIIGYGHTGKAVARKLSGFGARLIAYDKYLSGFSDGVVTEVGIEEIFRESDILTLHVPLTAETRYLACANFFNSFARPFFLLNLSRGPVARTADVLAALQSGRLLGAGLDVLEHEPLKALTEEDMQVYDTLFARENVLFSPHVGGWTFESAVNIQQKVLDEITALLEGN